MAAFVSVVALHVVPISLLPPLWWGSVGVLRVESGVLLAPL